MLPVWKTAKEESNDGGFLSTPLPKQKKSPIGDIIKRGRAKQNSVGEEEDSKVGIKEEVHFKEELGIKEEEGFHNVDSFLNVKQIGSSEKSCRKLELIAVLSKK